MPTILHRAHLPTFVVQDPREAAQALADQVQALLGERPESVLGLATGHTPILVYRELARRVEDGELSLARASTFNLDEYLGLAAEHPASFHEYMRARLFEHVDLTPEHRHLPCGLPAGEDWEAECARYEDCIAAAGGIDLQLLGIGRNGHIGFNEPGSARESRTRRVELSESTREANRPDFPPGEEVPRFALTMGIGTILEARRVRVMAFGEHKADIVHALLTGPVTAEVPASFLRGHADVELWIDEAAASRVR
jgi:glucosamine-6-phosphate deaminase